MSILLIILSVVIIFLAFYIMSEVVDKYFLKSLDNIASYLKLSDDIAGATLLAFGTSAPEISTALLALFLLSGSDAPGVGIGTIVGSAIFQILVVIGFSAVVMPSKLAWKPVLRDSIFYFISILLLIIFVRDNTLTFLESAGLVSFYLFYLAFLFFWSKTNLSHNPEQEEFFKQQQQQKSEVDTKNEESSIFKLLNKITKPIDLLLSVIPDSQKKPRLTIPVFIISLAIIASSSYIMVNAAQFLALSLGISPAIIALTILAGGTSIPEVISSAIVAKQGKGDMAIANAIGSNIFDILISLGLPVLIWAFLNGDVQNIGADNIGSSIVLLFSTLIVVILLMAAQKFHITRYFGWFLIFLYVVYIWIAYSGALAAFSL